MILYHSILLLLLVSVRGAVLMGGFGSPIDSNSPQVKSIHQYLLLQIPSLSGWTLTEIRSQVVSGRNYKFSFSHDADTAVIKVYQSLDLSLKIIYYSINNVQIQISQLKPLMADSPTLSQSNSQSNGGSKITQIDLLGNIDLKPFNLLAPKSDDSEKIWGTVFRQYPSLSSFEVRQIWKSEQNGTVFLIVSQSPGKDETVVFKVAQGANSTYDVQILQTNKVSGFTLEELSLFRDLCYDERPELREFLISSISNGETTSTLKFIFTHGNYYFIAYGFYQKAQRKIIFEQ